MKLPQYFKKLKKLRRLLLVRRVVGVSMEPALTEGRYIIATGLFGQIALDNVVIIKHNGLEKIKRVAKIRPNEIYVLGDNEGASSDSRHFGWLPIEAVIAKRVA